MNGQYAIKGYLFQSLVALLDSFESEWVTVCVEPNDESEKVDIRWTDSNNEKKVVQVKSSKNVIMLSSAEHWAKELKSKSPDASEYELTLVGCVDRKIRELKDNKLLGVLITNKDLSIEDFQSIIINKINVFFEKKGKNIITPRLGNIFTLALNQQILQDSVIGKTVKRDEFENSLLDKLETIEKHLERTAYNLLISNEPLPNENVKTTIINHILQLIGWKSLNKDENISLYDEKLGNNVKYKIDYWGNYDCPLKDNLKDIVYINANLDAIYPSDCNDIAKYNLFCFDSVRKNLIDNGRININDSIEHCIQFILSLNETEQNESISDFKDSYKGRLLNKDIIYYIIDNKQVSFLISSIITAIKYRNDLIPKFLYPITDDNSQVDKIGKRDTYLPPQYLNTSILPIIKEDDNKISALLFCSDPYSKDRLKKVLWLLIRLTSGLANEYKIYFPSFNSQYSNEVNEVIRSYSNNELTNRVYIENLPLCNSSELEIVPPNINLKLRNAEFDESANKKKRLKVEPHLIDYLPYGDSLKPFLASDAIKSENLKLFLKSKGVIFKTADKTKIIQLMTSMLFSPLDIDLLVDYVNINESPTESSSTQYSLIDKNKSMNLLCTNMAINENEIQKGLTADIVSFDQTKPTENADTYRLKLYLEQKNPNKQALVSIVRSTAIVEVRKDSTSEHLEFIKEYNSRPARLAAERVVKLLSEQLIKNNEIEDRSIEICFSNFTNKERINFLLSFTNIESSTIFTNFDAKSLKYMFDETAQIPTEYDDKIGKECITQLKGKNLDTIKEFQDDSMKDIILSEEMTINYRFKIRGVSGNYFIIMNFSNALKNSPIKDGIFNFKSKVYIDPRDREKVNDTHILEVQLKKEFNRLKKEKLQQFNMI